MKWMGTYTWQKKYFIRYYLSLKKKEKNSYQWLKLMSCGYTCREQILHRK